MRYLIAYIKWWIRITLVLVDLDITDLDIYTTDEQTNVLLMCVHPVFYVGELAIYRLYVNACGVMGIR